MALDKLGWNLIFHRVRLGPGKAIAMGFLRGKPIFCLPGGPPSNAAAFLLIAFPAITRMAGYQDLPYNHFTGVLEKDVRGQKDWTQVIHCHAERRGSSIRLIPLDMKRRLSSMASADGLLLIPEGVDHIPASTASTIHLPRGRTYEALTSMTVPHGIVLLPPSFRKQIEACSRSGRTLGS